MKCFGQNWTLCACALFFAVSAFATEVEILSLDVVPYESFIDEDAETLTIFKRALFEKGIAGIRGVPGYREKLESFIEKAREFASLSEEAKDRYAPNREKGDLFLGYEKGKEKFKGPDGQWVVDDLKVSFYAFVPDSESNKWPREVDLQNPFIELGLLMSEMGKTVMDKIDLTGPSTGIFMNDSPQVGRMLYYQKSGETNRDNPYWCGAHFDHGLITALTPASYFVDGRQIDEPQESGLFVKVEGRFQKVEADPEVLLFQVGEFGQLATDDAINATEHRVAKAPGSIERYAMVLFFNPPMEAVIHSYSELTRDARYGGKAGDPCSGKTWHEESFKRYIVKDN